MCTSVFCPSFFLDIGVFYLYLSASVLEADIVADRAGGSSAGLRQEKSSVGANANLVDSLPGPRGRGAGRGLPLWQPQHSDPPSVQGDLMKRERKLVRLGEVGQTKKRAK